MKTLIGYRVVCCDPIFAGERPLLKMNQPYEVLDQNADFIMVQYKGPHKGWFKTERFQIVEGLEEVNG